MDRLQIMQFQLLVLLWLKRRRDRYRERLYWVHPKFKQREVHGEYHRLIDEILGDEQKCGAYIRMKPTTFYDLLEIVGPLIEKRTTNFRKPLSAKERLIITLRYLASGENHSSLSSNFRAGVSTVRKITIETCVAIWTALQPKVMPKPNEEDWLRIASEFYTRFQFPLCLGAIDGRHIRIKKPHRSGSKYYNHKRYFSLVLLAITDANGKFVMVDVRSSGGNHDGGVLGHSNFGEKILSGSLSIPEKDVIPGTDIELPYMFVADDTFPLRDNLMKPFPQRQLSREKKMFNYRLSRARNCVDGSFGKLAQTWRILNRQMGEQPTAASNIVKAITVLHNFVISREPERQTVTITETSVATTPTPRRLLTYQNIEKQRYRATKSAMSIREKLMSYFVSAPVAWQNDYCD